MYQAFFARSPLLALPLVALVIFIAVFTAVVLRVMTRSRTSRLAELSQLPLVSDEEPRS